ncbi:MAG: helix-turn-helix domain-containing protein, partial [Solirubrobacteraceae bacterium]
MTKSTADLAAAIEQMERRLTALEAASGADASRPPGPAVPADPFWLLDRLARNTGAGFSRGEVAGSVAYGGRVRAPGAGELVWQLEHAVPDILEADLGAASAVLGALGHPLRLEILRRLLLGARTLGELQDIASSGTSGQVHHHLRELRAAGLVVSQRRNDYAIPADRVVALL